MLSPLWKACSHLVSNFDLSTLLVFTVVFLFVLSVISTPRSDIPGPFALPIFGNILFLARMGNRRYRETIRLHKKYGDIFRLYIGKRMMVTICGYENIYEAFVKNAAVMSNRPDGLFDSQTKYGTIAPGIIMSSGEVWRKNRRFTMQTMRDFGMGKKSLEEVIADEAKILCADIAAFNGKPIGNIRELLSVSVSNTVHGIVFGYRCDHDDEQFLIATKAIETLFTVPSIVYRSLPTFLRRLVSYNSLCEDTTVESFKFVGAYYRGLRVSLLNCGDVISLMRWFSVSVRKINLSEYVFVEEVNSWERDIQEYDEN